jgi:phosphoribosylformimino-5-aminoimidazole carboxamide ribotide isomerase
MRIIPAIDLKNGKCVRLLQGDLAAETVYADDPVDAARRWEAAGATLLHVVDLEGAVRGEPAHQAVIARILAAVRIPVQLGGGLRDRPTVERALEAGVARVVIGTEAIRNPALIDELCRAAPGRIAVGIDARDGKVAIQGWTETTAFDAVQLARRFEQSGVAALIFTDIRRDGMQTGPNIDQTRALAAAVRIPVIASGGVGGLEDIRRLLPLEPLGVEGVIVGRALYSGALRFAEAAALAAGGGIPERAA